MSRSGHIFVRPRPNASLICNEIVAEGARQIASTSRPALDFQIANYALLFSPIDDLVKKYENDCVLSGSSNMNFFPSDLSEAFESARECVLDICQSRNIPCPTSLSSKPQVLTTSFISCLEQVSRNTSDKVLATAGQEAAKQADLAIRAFRIACVEAADPTTSGVDGLQMFQTIVESRVLSHNQTEAVDLASAYQRAQMRENLLNARLEIITAAILEGARQVGFDSLLLSNGRVRAVDTITSPRFMEVVVNASANRINFELYNFQDDSCAEYQRKFTEATMNLLGIDPEAHEILETTDLGITCSRNARKTLVRHKKNPHQQMDSA